MEFVRRMSTRAEDLDEEDIKQLTAQSRRPSTTIDNEIVLPAAIDPPIEVFPGAISRKQTTLIVTPEAANRGWTITHGITGAPFMTAVTPSTTIGVASHTKHFYADLAPLIESSRIKKEDAVIKDTNSNWGKLCTMNRDVISFRRRHHIEDPYSKKCLMEMEFTLSSWDSKQLKAHIRLLSQYSDSKPMQPIPLVWRGSKTNLEGVLEWKNKPVAVCAQGHETQDGEYALYVAPGMDVYTAAIVVIAVDDRVRRSSSEIRQENLSNALTEEQDLVR